MREAPGGLEMRPVCRRAYGARADAPTSSPSTIVAQPQRHDTDGSTTAPHAGAFETTSAAASPPPPADHAIEVRNMRARRASAGSPRFHVRFSSRPVVRLCGMSAARLRMCADAPRGNASDASVEMVARAVEDAGRRLHDLRREEWEDGAVAAVALALAVAASTVRPAFALPLFISGVFVACRAVLAGWRRWDLLDRLVVEPDAYGIPEVRARGEQEASMASRRWLSRAIRSRLELAGNPRIVANADELAALAEELLDSRLVFDPACAATCSRLLTDGVTSPLINSELPLENVRSRLVQIRSGFHERD